MRPYSVRQRLVRHRKSWSSSSLDGCLKENTWQPETAIRNCRDETGAVRGGYGQMPRISVARMIRSIAMISATVQKSGTGSGSPVTASSGF